MWLKDEDDSDGIEFSDEDDDEVLSLTFFFGKSQFPYKSVNLFLQSVTVKDKLTNLWRS